MKTLFLSSLLSVFVINASAQSICGNIVNFNDQLANTGTICAHNDSITISFNAPHNCTYELWIYEQSGGSNIDTAETSIYFNFQNNGGPQTFTYPWDGTAFYSLSHHIPFLYGTFDFHLLVSDNSNPQANCDYDMGIQTYSPCTTGLTELSQDLTPISVNYYTLLGQRTSFHSNEILIEEKVYRQAPSTYTKVFKP